MFIIVVTYLQKFKFHSDFSYCMNSSKSNFLQQIHICNSIILQQILLYNSPKP